MMDERMGLVPDWLLERYRFGELPDDQRDAVRRALADDAGLRERLAQLEHSDEELLARHPPARIAAQLRARLRDAPAARPVRRPALALAASAALAAGAFALLPSLRTARPSEDVTRVKGLAPQLLVYRKPASDAVERLQPGSIARDHDVLQVAYQSAGRRYGVIVSVDGRGHVTRHLPVAGVQAAALQPGAAVPLPTAYELDDAPGFERFYLVAADEVFTVESVVAAVRRRHAQAAARVADVQLDLPASMDQFSLALKKEPAR